MRDKALYVLGIAVGAIIVVSIVAFMPDSTCATAYKRGMADGISTTDTMHRAVSIRQEDLDAMEKELKR